MQSIDIPKDEVRKDPIRVSEKVKQTFSYGGPGERTNMYKALHEMVKR